MVVVKNFVDDFEKWGYFFDLLFWYFDGKIIVFEIVEKYDLLFD